MAKRAASVSWFLLLAGMLVGHSLTSSVVAQDGAKGNAKDNAKREMHFERHVRPLLVERCHKCHAGNVAKGGLRVDGIEALLKGGETGPAIVPGKAADSLLLHAVRHQDGLAMPPDGKLTETQIRALEEWIEQGAMWPGQPMAAPASAAANRVSPAVTPLAPNTTSLAGALQLWLKADSLSLADGEAVPVWPDASGRGRDVSATKGVRAGGVGMPGKFAKESRLLRRPAVRFDTTTGFASSPDNPLPVKGDASLTILLVMNLQRHEAQPPFDGVVGIGNPAHPGDPGRPLAALVQINRGENHALHFAGGWNHDASLGAGSFQPYYDKPLLLTVVKRPGPMRTTTQIFVNGMRVGPTEQKALEGRDGIPDIQHRTDIGAYLGKALAWCGSIQGDVGEVVVYDRALEDADRLGVEAHLAEKYGLMAPSLVSVAPRPQFTEKESAHWAYQPVRPVTPPEVKDESWVQSPIDRFVLQRLEQQGLAPAPPADRRTLLRRMTFDLTGLPPTPEEVDAFLADGSPRAWETVVDRLLQSPHYGERWGRHWLDVVRYGESTANDANAVMRFAWRYRNYVIDAFQRDLPYDQFLLEQLAGDLLTPTNDPAEDARRRIATGFLMVGPKALAETDKEQSRLDIVDDQIDVVGRAMLGLTLACARCHDHKFDAIRAVDYYALAGVFRSTEPFQNENRNATMWWEFPVENGGMTPITVMAPKETTPKNLRVHLRGNRFTLGAVAPRGALSVVEQTCGVKCELDPNQPSSGRLELARWIVHPDNPLTARVMVNRVWQHHFGRGLVTTSDNLGARGDPPSHPELLDWLAHQFRDGGWSVKRLHRLILLSSTYQQSVQASESSARLDPDRRWRSSFVRRRLSAEELRDAILAASGSLDRRAGSDESGEFLFGKAEDINSMIRPNRVTSDDPFYTQFRKRSVYLPVVRNMLPDVLALFDAADPNGVTTVRNETTVASQSLFMLNNPLVRDEAKLVAERMLVETGTNDEARVNHVHRSALGRNATDEEQREALTFIAEYIRTAEKRGIAMEAAKLRAWQSYVQSLWCSNEFLYVE